MVKKKIPYESPDIRATHVELESSICDGSTKFVQNEEGSVIEAQEINKDFKSDNTSGYFNDSWGSSSSSESGN